MNDYISREDAINAIEFGITHAKAFNKETGQIVELFKESNKELSKAAERVKALPAADVVEVIRCKDCKYFNLNKWGKVNNIPLIVAHEICDFWGEGCKTDKDGYCSFAERRQE